MIDGSKPLLVEAHEILTPDRFDGGDGAPHFARIRMGAVERLREGVARHRCRVVFVLADRGDQRFLARGDFAVLERGMPRDVGGERQHRIEIVGEAGGCQRHLVTAGNHRQRRAAAVKLVGNDIRRPL